MRPRLELEPEVARRVAAARFVMDKAAEDLHIYGTNTGFGALSERRVGAEQMSDLQYRHVVSHDAASVRRSRRICPA